MTTDAERDRLIALHAVIWTRNDLGVEEETVGAEIEKAWAKVLFGTGAERRQAGAEGASQSATFRVLSTTALRGAAVRDCIRFDSRDWNITNIAPIGGTACEIEFTAVVAKG